MKAKLIEANKPGKFETKLNEFIKDVMVIDIKYLTSGGSFGSWWSALVLYIDKEKEKKK